jgi:hypothetical protein
VKHPGSHSQERANQIEEIRRNPNVGKKDASHLTIFHDLLSGTLPKSEKSTEHLAEEAVLLVGAGKHTLLKAELPLPRPQSLPHSKVRIQQLGLSQ